MAKQEIKRQLLHTHSQCVRIFNLNFPGEIRDPGYFLRDLECQAEVPAPMLESLQASPFPQLCSSPTFTLVAALGLLHCPRHWHWTANLIGIAALSTSLVCAAAPCSVSLVKKPLTLPRGNHQNVEQTTSSSTCSHNHQTPLFLFSSQSCPMHVSKSLYPKLS